MSGFENKNICQERRNYSIYQKGILRKKLFRIPSESVLNFSVDWNKVVSIDEGNRKRAETMNLPQKIKAGRYFRYLTFDKSEEKEYYLLIETMGGSFRLKINGDEVAIGSGEQRFYEICVTESLLNGVNAFCMEFFGEEEVIWDSVQFLIRPKNHIRDYNLSITCIDENNIHVEIDVSYHGEMVKTTCILIAPKGRNIQKIRLENGKASFDTANKEFWNTEECKQHTITFITDEETIAEKVPVYFAHFYNKTYIVNKHPVYLCMVNWMKSVGVPCDTLLYNEIKERLSAWKQRNINAIYVDKEADSILLRRLCIQYGFYYISSEENFKMVKKELILDRNGEIHSMTGAYIPMKVWTVNNETGSYAMKSEMEFANMKDYLYVRISTYHKGKRVGQNVKYILDFSPEIVETSTAEWYSRLQGDIKVRIEFYQRLKTELVPKNHFYGVKEICFHKPE